MDGVLGIVKTLWNILNTGSIGGRERYTEKKLDLDQYYDLRKRYGRISFDRDYRYFPKLLAQAPLSPDVYRLIKLSKKYKVIIEGSKKEHLDHLEENLPKLAPKLVSGARIVFLDHKVFNQKAKKLRLYNPQDIKAFAHQGSLFVPSEDQIDADEFIHQLCEVYRFNHLKPPDKETKEKLFKKYKFRTKMQNTFFAQGQRVEESRACTAKDICIEYAALYNMVTVDIPQEALGGEAIIKRFRRKRSSHSKHDRWDLKEMGWAKGRTLRIPLEDFENPVCNFANVLGIKKTSMDKIYEAFRDYPAQDVISEGGELFYKWWQAAKDVTSTPEADRFKQVLLKRVELLKDEGLITHERYEQIAKYKWHKQKSKTEPPRYTPSSYTGLDFCNVIYLAYQYPQYLGWILRESDE